MKLTYEQIASVVQGVVNIEQTEEGIQFYRFTKEQLKEYDNSRFHPKQYSTAGVRLHFQTDSETLQMKVVTSKVSSRRYFAHDVLVDGKWIGALKNDTEDITGEFRDTFRLGKGIKAICIHFPWSVCSVLKELSLDENAIVIPIKKENKILVYGDSITQGYDAAHPVNRYAARLADYLNAEEYNKAIGGELFCPWLAETKDDIEPDYISVAYGTNHWHRSSSRVLKEDCERFFDNLVRNYPNAKIFAITPIWRADRTEVTQFSCFEEIGEVIEDVVKKYDNVVCISGRQFVPEDGTLFWDSYLHPNDAGFEYYSENIVKAVSMK